MNSGKEVNIMAIQLPHAAERATFSVLIDAAIKNINKDRSKNMIKIVDLMEKTMGDTWKPEAYENIRNVFRNPDSKYMKYTNGILDNIDPKILKMALLNLGYEAGFRGFHQVQENQKKYGVSIPWVILMDPTSACNMHCTGCWAAEYGYTKSLSYEQLDSVITQGEALGIHAWIMTGGEPLTRKNDIIKLCEKHQTSAFMAFTNATLIDDKFAEDMLRVANFVPSISIEGFKEANDGRRGDGHFDAVMKAMDILKAHKLLFGTSICYTSVNYKVVTSDEFLDMLIEKGVKFTWYFHYMPVGNAASPALLLNPEQREYMYHRVREIRGYDTGKPIFAIDFQNDGEFVHGCIAGGKYYCHINPNGDVEPCVFVHYSQANVKEKSLLDCLRQPLFKAYQAGQPFNEDLLQPCPMLENPEKLRAIVHETNAPSTDMESPEEVDHLVDKCVDYAKEWAPTAEKLWSTNHFDDGKSDKK
jgi:MoaA/NifB/PqqE/SkfB family radical SAM enzyme